MTKLLSIGLVSCYKAGYTQGHFRRVVKKRRMLTVLVLEGEA